MKTRDQILLENMYLKTKTVVKEEVQNDNIFSALVNLDLYDGFESLVSVYPPAGDDTHYEIPQKVKVHYRLDVQYGSAGITSIYANLVGIDPIRVERIKYTENEEEMDVIDIDLSDVSFTGPVASDEHGQIIASAVEIHLNEDNKAERVTLVF
jgi:hypothetical protein